MPLLNAGRMLNVQLAPPYHAEAPLVYDNRGSSAGDYSYSS